MAKHDINGLQLGHHGPGLDTIVPRTEEIHDFSCNELPSSKLFRVFK